MCKNTTVAPGRHARATPRAWGVLIRDFETCNFETSRLRRPPRRATATDQLPPTTNRRGKSCHPVADDAPSHARDLEIRAPSTSAASSASYRAPTASPPSRPVPVPPLASPLFIPPPLFTPPLRSPPEAPFESSRASSWALREGSVRAGVLNKARSSSAASPGEMRRPLGVAVRANGSTSAPPLESG